MTVTDTPPTAAVPRVVAVVVAYDRRELLMECLTALGGQTHALERIVVVDNASSDGTSEAARKHAARPDVVTLPRNTGGAGGFAAGIAHALEHYDPQWVWLMDDDTIPAATALSELLRVSDEYEGPVRVLGSRAVWTDGQEHPMNTPRRRPRVGWKASMRASMIGAVPVRTSSFVSMLVRADAVRHFGLPIADYFIWNDDFEYSARLLHSGVGLHVPTSIVEHRTKVFGSTDADPGARFYYEVRNKIWLFAHARDFGLLDYLAYAGSSAVRWVRTVLRSSDKLGLAKAGLRGVRDGIATNPRPTTEVLADLGTVSDDVAAIQAAAFAGGGGRG